MRPLRDLVVVLGDQLTRNNPALEGVDPGRDRVLFVEAAGEAAHVWSHQARIALFLAAMRHFAADLQAEGLPVDCLRLGEHSFPTLAAAWVERIAACKPRRVVACEPGESRVLLRHEGMFAGNPRTALMARNATRLSEADRQAVLRRADVMLGDLESL